MEAFLVAGVALLLIVLLLVLPSGRTPHDDAHLQTHAAMEQVADDAKDQITRLHRAYRAELARTVKHRAAIRRLP
jgi:hypothetical protein